MTLFVRDLGACVRFYRETLGLELLEESDRFALVSAGGCILGIHAHDGPSDPTCVNLHFRVADVDRACVDLQAAGVEVSSPPRDRPWGLRAAELLDPAGRRIELVGPMNGRRSPDAP